MFRRNSRFSLQKEFHICASFWRREPISSDAVQLRYFCNFILLIFYLIFLFFHVCTNFWRREPTPTEAMHFKLNQSRNSSVGLCMLVLRGKNTFLFILWIKHYKGLSFTFVNNLIANHICHNSV